VVPPEGRGREVVPPEGRGKEVGSDTGVLLTLSCWFSTGFSGLDGTSTLCTGSLEGFGTLVDCTALVGVVTGSTVGGACGATA
jgi:hypothetical protein